VKLLTISDDWNNGTALVCEHHFKKIKSHITAAKTQGVHVAIESVRKRGCRFCRAAKIGFSPWASQMFPVWRGFKQSESR